MLDVFFTVDVEVWCNGWDDLDKKFRGHLSSTFMAARPYTKRTRKQNCISTSSGPTNRECRFCRTSARRGSTCAILSHNIELLNRARHRPDDIVVSRFLKLCAFLERNRDSFRVTGFKGLQQECGHAATRPAQVAHLAQILGKEMNIRRLRCAYKVACAAGRCKSARKLLNWWAVRDSNPRPTD